MKTSSCSRICTWDKWHCHIINPDIGYNQKRTETVVQSMSFFINGAECKVQRCHDMESSKMLNNRFQYISHTNIVLYLAIWMIQLSEWTESVQRLENWGLHGSWQDPTRYNLLTSGGHGRPCMVFQILCLWYPSHRHRKHRKSGRSSAAQYFVLQTGASIVGKRIPKSAKVTRDHSIWVCWTKPRRCITW